jgi:hypothetical protein
MSIHAGRALLELCQSLASKGITPPFQPGDVLARGFADLGFEEFCILPGNLILSLQAGKVAPLPEEDRHRFFWVPTVEQFLDEIDKRGADIQRIEFPERRQWRIVWSAEGAEMSHEHRVLRVCLGQALCRIIEG